MPTLSTGRYFVSIFDISIYFERQKFMFCVNDKMNKHTIGYHFSCPAKDNLWVPSYKQNEDRHQEWSCDLVQSPKDVQCPKKLQPMREATQGNLYEKKWILRNGFIVPRNLETGIIDVCGFSAIGAKNWVDAVTEWTDWDKSG